MHGKAKAQNRWREDYLYHIRKGRPDTIAARAAGVNKSRIIQERQRDEGFASQVEEAKTGRKDRQVRW